jgi:hypothetical protein
MARILALAASPTKFPELPPSNLTAVFDAKKFEPETLMFPNSKILLLVADGVIVTDRPVTSVQVFVVVVLNVSVFAVLTT